MLFVAGPDGDIVIEHVKYGGNILEGTLKGSGEIQYVETEYGRLAGIICWDTNYPNIVRQVGQQNVNILLSPSKEWDGINPMHAEMAVFRAIENGAAVFARRTKGYLLWWMVTAVPWPAVKGLADSGNYLLTEVPTSSPTTLYPVIGDVVGIISTVGLVIIVVYALINDRRQKKEVQQTAVVTS